MSTSLQPTPDTTAHLALLLALRDLAGEAVAIDLENEARFPDEIVELRRIVEQTIERIAALQAHYEPEALVECQELEVPSEPDAWMSGSRSSATSSVADISFAGGLELKRVLRDLVAAPATEERLFAAESARRKVRRAIRATLEAAWQEGMDVLGGEHQGHHQVADVASGLAVRRLYARFRRSLRRPTERDADTVLAAVRYAGGALATLVTSPDYADVRASDRAVLRKLRERALHWARHDRRPSTGMQLIEDLWTCGDLLRGINQRQELQQHDRELSLKLASGPSGDIAAWFAALEPLLGTDDQLDAILDAARVEAPDALEPLVPEALACLTRRRR